MRREGERRIVEEESFKVAGISARTSNAAEAGPNGAIPKLWGRLGQESLMRNLQHKSSDDVIAVYTDYEKGKEGAYTYILGAKIRSPGSLPQDTVVRDIMAGPYEIFKTEDGSIKALIDLWQRIWALEDDGHLKRAYRTDFEVHPQPKPDAQTSAVEIYVGIES